LGGLNVDRGILRASEAQAERRQLGGRSAGCQPAEIVIHEEPAIALDD
jgi:hypothetical protein